MQHKQLFITAIIIATIAFSSCSKNDTSAPPPIPTNSRNISYEVSGNFTGTLFVSYTTMTGSTLNETIILPWNKTIIYGPSVDAVIIAVSGNGGVIGQTAKVVLKQNGIQKSATTATDTGKSGSFSITAPALVF